MKKYILLVILLILNISLLKLNDNEIITTSKEMKYASRYFKVKEDIEFDVYSKHYVKDLVSKTNATIINNTKLDTSSIGEFNITVKYKYYKKIFTRDITYRVVDREKPKFISVSTYRTIAPRDSFNPCIKAVYADNYDKKVKCYIEGDYDPSEEGTYYVKYVLKDSSGNKLKKSLTIRVKEPVIVEDDDNTNTNTNSSKPKVYYSYMKDIKKKFKNKNTMIGIDISEWQGNIDFKKVKKEGVEFVIMRIGVHSYPEDSIHLDNKFKTYFKAAKNAKLKVGVYFYSTASNRSQGIEMAKWVIKTLDGAKLDLPVGYDWENWKWFKEYKMSLHDLDESYQGFKSTLKKSGYKSMLYGSAFYLKNIWPDADNELVWMAHYTDETNYSGNYMLWQQCSDANIDGIQSNRTDVNILYKKKFKIS